MNEHSDPPATINLWLNGAVVCVAAGTMVSTVFLNSGIPSRVSISGAPRAPICGMGICFECRATVDGVPHRRTCQLPCREGMRLDTAL
jgi:sarcosine oxidase subunit alpha